MLNLLSKQAVLFVASSIVASQAVAADAPVLTCMGTREPGVPAVILEAGAGNGVEAWAKIQPAIAKFARVCAYDRPGLRRYWKDDEPPAAPTPDTVVDTLERALTNAGERPPYVLVGHSYGGMIVRLFAGQYPDRIRGVVLIDSSHEDQMRRFGDPPPVTPPPGASGVVVNLPEAIDLVAMSDALRARPWRTTASLLVLTRGNAGAAKPPTPPDAAAVARYQIWLELQRELATRSTVAEQVIAKQSGHFIQNDEPQLVIDGIRRMLESK